MIKTKKCYTKVLTKSDGEVTTFFIQLSQYCKLSFKINKNCIILVSIYYVFNIKL